MFCNNCGQKREEGFNFCTKCGKNFNSNLNNNGYNSEVHSNEPSSGKIIVLLFVMVLSVFSLTNMRIKQKVALTRIPYANQTIEPGTKITSDMIAYMEVQDDFLWGTYYRDVEAVIGKCTAPSAMVAEGSIFYVDLVVDCDEIASYNNFDDYEY